MLHTIPLNNEPSWQEVLADLVSDPRELLHLLGLSNQDVNLSPQAMRQFPLRVPRPFLARMRPGDPHDPLLRQVLPLQEEDHLTPGFSEDPLQERAHNPQPGLLHKYHGRALLLPTASCAIHCRYCFRRHFHYEENNPGRRQWGQALDYLAQDTTIEEVILSGGDPLAAPDRHLSWLCEQLADIPHLQRLRIHTRLPLMIPQRVNEELLEWLTHSRLQAIVVLHSNHAQEFDEAVDRACERLRGAGAMLLNQSVLLRSINDSAAALVALSKRMSQAGVLPYYLHLPDKTQGTAHFDVSQPLALRLLQEMQALLPGYLVPRLVREEAGEPAKSPVHHI